MKIYDRAQVLTYVLKVEAIVINLVGLRITLNQSKYFTVSMRTCRTIRADMAYLIQLELFT